MDHRKAQAMRLRIRLLGPPTFEYGRRPIILRRRQVRALLCYLASVSEPIPRERLCSLFWPDCPEIQARRKLSHLATHLQRAMPPGRWLNIQGDQIGLSFPKVWVDLHAFAEALPASGAGRSPLESRPLDRQTLDRLQDAIKLYRGDLMCDVELAESSEFELWACTEREHWRREYLRALALLVNGYAALGDLHSAIKFATGYLETDELSEEMHRQLIELYAASGQRACALRQYELCVATLERELGVDPLPETRAVYQAALRGAAPIPALSTEPLPPPLLDAPLVGREHAMAMLSSAAQTVLQTSGRMVFVTGEAGIGKTRLAHEFLSAFALGASGEHHVRILMSSAHPGESKIPYFPLLSSLRASLRTADWQVLCARLDDVWITECMRILPEIRAWRRDLRPSFAADAGYSRAQLFQALTHLFLTIAGDDLLVLFLDDLHWVDETTLAWLGTFARSISKEKVLVLLTYRSDEITAELRGLQEIAARLRLSLTVPLSRLSADQVVEMVRRLTDHHEDAAPFGERLYRDTDGNPFFVLETLRALLHQSAERPTTGEQASGWDCVIRQHDELPLPESVRSLLLARLRVLSPVARQIVDLAAVIGPTSTHSLLWRTSGRSEAELADALDELTARQILCELTPSSYAFTHERLYETAYHDLSTARRRLLHRRVGNTLSARDPNAVVALSHHFEQAQDMTRAAQYALRAAQAAQAVFGHGEARAHFERVLLLLESVSREAHEPGERIAQARMRVEALDGRGWVLRLLGEMDAYTRDLDQVAILARVLDDRKLQARATWRQAYAALWFCRYDQVVRTAEKGIALCRAVGDVETEMECRWTMALAWRALGDYARARRGLNRAWKHFAAHGSVVAQVHLLSSLSTLHLQEKRHAEAERTARQALALCDQEHLSYHRRLPLGDLGALAAAHGDGDRARLQLSESLAIAQAIADRTQELFCLGHLGWLSLKLNDERAADEYFTCALHIAQTVGSRAEQSWLHAGLAESYARAGHLAAASEAAQQALAIALELGQRPDQAAARALLRRFSSASARV